MEISTIKLWYEMASIRLSLYATYEIICAKPHSNIYIYLLDESRF